MATQLSGSTSVAQPQQFVATTDAASLLSAEAKTLWQQAPDAATSLLAALLTRADRDTLLNEVFGRAGTEATAFEANKQALLEAIGTTGLKIAIDLRSGTEMEGAIGAYAQVAPNVKEQIYVNADWINAGNLSLKQLTAVVLEEYGHETMLSSHTTPYRITSNLTFVRQLIETGISIPISNSTIATNACQGNDLTVSTDNDANSLTHLPLFIYRRVPHSHSQSPHPIQL